MKDLIKKLEEQITFIQHEMSQMSEEIYSQQKNIAYQKVLISKIQSKITSIEENEGKYNSDDDPLPPHY